MMKLQVSGGAFILLAAMVLIFPLQWVAAVILAAVIHEIWHCIAVCLTGGHIQSVTIGSRGITIYTQPMAGAQEIICAIAGPVGSLSLLLWARWIPRTAVCGLIHGMYNLLPLLPLDGGRALRGIFQCLFSPPVANRLCLYSQRGVRLLMIVVCVLLISKVGILAIILGIFLLAKKSFWQYNRGILNKGERL